MPGSGLGAHSPGSCVQITTSTSIYLYLELRPFRKLILHLTTRTDDSHATLNIVIKL